MIRSEVEALRSRLSLAETQEEIVPIEDAPGRIRKVRKAQGLTQVDLAELSGVAPITVIKIEGGETTIQLESLLSVLKALGLKLYIG